MSTLYLSRRRAGIRLGLAAFRPAEIAPIRFAFAKIVSFNSERMVGHEDACCRSCHHVGVERCGTCLHAGRDDYVTKFQTLAQKDPKKATAVGQQIQKEAPEKSGKIKTVDDSCAYYDELIKLVSQ